MVQPPIVLLLIGLAQAAAVRPAPHRGAEGAIVSAVDAGNAAALALLEKAVNINSGTHHLPGVRAVGDIFRREFDDLGFKTTWIDGVPAYICVLLKAYRRTFWNAPLAA